MKYDKSVFRENMKYLRGLTHLGQEKFSEEIGISQRSISAYERDDPNPTLDSLILISQYCNLTIEELLTQKLSERTFNYGMRKPNAGATEFLPFQGNSYYLYYLSDEHEDDKIPFYDGILTFDDHYDEEHLFLHGIAMTGHAYDCKMVIEDHHTFHIYGTCSDLERRFYMVMFYPDFRNRKQYIGGLGTLIRTDSRGFLTGLKIGVSIKKLNLGNEEIRDKLFDFLAERDQPKRLFAKREVDFDFENWIEQMKPGVVEARI